MYGSKCKSLIKYKKTVVCIYGLGNRGHLLEGRWGVSASAENGADLDSLGDLEGTRESAFVHPQEVTNDLFITPWYRAGTRP